MKNFTNVSTKKDNYKFSNYLKTIFLCLLIFQFVGLSVSADNLTAVAATGSDVISQTPDWEAITTTAGLTVAVGDKVMVIASFTCYTTAGTQVDRDMYFRIAQDVGGTPSYSNEITRFMNGVSDGDKGIGTLVYVFTIGTGNAGSKTYTLQHKLEKAKGSQTDATITAINLTTSGSEALDNSFKAITTAVTIAHTVTSFSEVTGTVSDAITLTVPGGLYFAASINSAASTASADNEGEWQMQYQEGGQAAHG